MFAGSVGSYVMVERPSLLPGIRVARCSGPDIKGKGILVASIARWREDLGSIMTVLAADGADSAGEPLD
jgi:hypothetical protein